MADLLCPVCESLLEAPGTQCSECGWVVAAASGVSLSMSTARPGVVAERFDPATGTAQHSLRAPLSVGKSNQDLIARSLAAELSKRFAVAIPILDGQDDKGEDFLLALPAGKTQTVQVTLAISDPTIWRELQAGGATEHAASQEELVAALRGSIKRKAATSSKVLAGLWLVLDAGNTPAAGRPEIAREYLARFPDPLSEFGFGDVLIFGGIGAPFVPVRSKAGPSGLKLQ